MDFGFTEVQRDLRELARKILIDAVTPGRLKQLEAMPCGPDRMDAELWRAFADAGLLAVALPEQFGGSGFGLLELCVLLEEVGRTVAPIPLLACVGMAALPMARFGDADLCTAVLPGVADGSMILTAALQEAGSRDARRPLTTATADGTTWRLAGEKVAVPWAPVASHLLVSTSDGLFLVEAASPGVDLAAAEATDRTPQATLTLDGAAAVRVGGPDAVAFAIDVAIAGMCATAVGVFDEAVRITASYMSQRQQFGKPLATFQGAAMRVADAYIDTQAISVAAWSAIWRLTSDLPANDALDVAKFWVADGGQRVAHACQHLHGGMGVDIDYPIHRYFLWAKELELTLGGAIDHLLSLGSSLCTSI
jgi:alkylation response protein AidB-like acyl-CoA dehydrogenase